NSPPVRAVWGVVVTGAPRRAGPPGTGGRRAGATLSALSPAGHTPAPERFAEPDVPGRLSPWAGGRFHRSPEALVDYTVRVPERFSERSCSFGARDTKPRDSPVSRVNASPSLDAVCRLTGRPRRARTSTSRELVLDRGHDVILRDRLGRKLRDRTGQLTHGPSDPDTEHALTALQEVEHLLLGGALEHRTSVGEQCDRGQILDTTGPSLINGIADVLQRDPGVQQLLGDLQDEDVLERVQALTARSRRVPDRGDHQIGTSPVVELAVGDTGDLARDRYAVSAGPVRDAVIREQAGL